MRGGRLMWKGGEKRRNWRKKIRVESRRRRRRKKEKAEK